MTQPPPTPSAVEQVDRDAAAPWADGHRNVGGYTFSLGHLIRTGQADDHEMVQAFARHRQAGLVEAAGIAREQFADAGWSGHYKNAGERIATAILAVAGRS